MFKIMQIRDNRNILIRFHQKKGGYRKLQVGEYYHKKIIQELKLS